MRYLYIIISIILILSSNIVEGKSIRFNKIGHEQGISQISVYSITQDSTGYIWFGTRNGLNRFDGEQIKTFNTNSSDSTSLVNNFIKQISASNHKVWIQTQYSISYYDIYKEIFKNFIVDNINSFFIDKDRVWIATETGVLFIENDKLSHYNNSGLKGHKIKEIAVNREAIYIATDRGVFQIKSDNVITMISSIIDCSKIFFDDKNRIWIGSKSKGVELYSSNMKLIKTVNSDNILSNNIVRDIEQDNNGNIWIGTFYGLDMLDPETMSEIHYSYNSADPYSLSNNSIYDICKDRDGTIWIGTYFGGANYFNPTGQDIEYYRQSVTDRGLNFNVIGPMAESEDGEIWVGTDGGGINILDRESRTFKYLKHLEGVNSISHNNIKSILIGDDNKILIGTHTGGLNVYDTKSDKFIIYKHKNGDSNSIPNNTVPSIIKFRDKYIVGTHGGVATFDIKSGKFSPLIDDFTNNHIFAMLLDRDLNLWIGTEKEGLFKFNTISKKLKHYSHKIDVKGKLRSNLIQDIYEDIYSRIWIGTSDGLSLYNSKDDNFSHYSVDDGLSGNSVLKILQSRYGNLIITTNKGISIFNYSKSTFTNFINKNGFDLQELNERGALITSDGEIFIGGVDGMASFYEKDIINRENSNPIHLTKLEVNNLEITPNNRSKILTKSIGSTTRIDLKYNQNTIGISFSDFSYLKHNHPQVEYKLSGFDKNWHKVEDKNRIIYRGLEPGSYKLKLRKGLNKMDSPIVTTLILEITPPFYKTVWAYLIYIMLLLSLIYYLNHLYLNGKRLKDTLALEHNQLENMEELNQSKLKLFTNISHEFRTPLTLISGETDMLLQKNISDIDTQKRISRINKHTVRLNALITELMDFRKQESGFLSIKASENNITRLVNEVFLSFSEIASTSKINYINRMPSTPIDIWFDKHQMEKVLYNLLSNAFKFTKKGGDIEINSTLTDRDISITIFNSGAELDQENIDLIFDRFYQVEKIKQFNNIPGTGIGLALTKGIIEAHHGEISVENIKDKGVLFTITLALGDKHFSEDEIIEDYNISEPLKQIIFESKDDNIKRVCEQNKFETILVIEDDSDIRDFLIDIFQNNYNVIEAIDGEEGVALAKEIVPDIIISDVVMPKVEGTEVCNILKSDNQTSHIPIILITARTAMEYKIEGLETGADDYITKPFNPQVLISRVNNLLNNRDALKSKYSHNPMETIRSVSKSNSDREFVENAKRAVLKNIDISSYSVIDFSKDMGIGRTKLFAKIKKATGQTPNDFIVSIRIKRAAELLLISSEKSISEIAYSCGFSTPHYFSRCFKKIMGVAPSVYIKENTKE